MMKSTWSMLRVSHLLILLVSLFFLFVSIFSLAQDAPVPGVLSGVGPDASLAGADVLKKSTAPRKKTTTSKVKPPKVRAVQEKNGSIWIVKKITFTGDIEFAESQKLRERIMKAIASDNGKTRKMSVDQALKTIRGELLHDGYYLVKINRGYEEATKTLNVKVDAGVFGGVKVTFKDCDGVDGRWYSKRQIERRFSDLKKGDTFNYRTLYRRLSEVNASPDLTLDTHISVRSDDENEESNRQIRYADLSLAVQESFPLHAMLEFNNYATDELDNWQSQLTLQYLNLTRSDDVLTISPGMTLNGDLRTVAASYLRPHHIYKGGASTVYGGWSDLDCDNVVPRIDLQGTGWFSGFVESFKLIDTDDSLLSLSGGVLYRYIEDQFSANLNGRTYSLQERNASILPLTVSLSYSDRSPDFLSGRNFAVLSGVYNLWTGGDNDLDQMWYGAEDNYMIARFQLARIQPLFGDRDANDDLVHQWTLFMRAEGQYSPEPLIPAEKLFFGGYRTVRGYTPKCTLGDSGAYGTAEVRTPILLDTAAHLFREKSAIPLDRTQFVVFFDAGYAQQEDPLPGAIDNETMLSAGAGMRLAVTSYSQFRFDYGVPLVDIDSDDDDSEGAFYVSGQLQF